MEEESKISKILQIPEVKVLLNLEKKCCEEVYLHSCRVAEYTDLILKEYAQFSEEEEEEIVKGALVHDIGKLFLPFNVTEIPRQLTDNEFEMVKIHTNIGFEMVEDVFSEKVCNITRMHHEKPDGSGYSGHLDLAKLPDEVLIVQVADIYDALTSYRSYKNSYAKSKAISIMRNDAYRMKLDDGFLALLSQGLEKQNKIKQERGTKP